MLVTFPTADQESKLPNDEMYTMDEFCTMKRHSKAVKKNHPNNVRHINSNCEVQMIFNEAFMNFMENKKISKGKK